MNLTDYYIQKKIEDGDIGAFEQLFSKYYDPLCRHANSIVRDMDMAEDLVQEFFYQFWKNRESFTPKLSLNAYLYHSIRNNALHYLEHLAVRKNYAAHVLNEFHEMLAGPVSTDIELHDLSNLINATLDTMPQRCARIFRMNRFEGMKYHEIAAALAVSVKTVEADMGKALQMLRAALKEYTGNETPVSK